MGELRLSLLGRPHVTCDDTPVAGWALRKSLAPLVYLAVTGRWPACRRAAPGIYANAWSRLRSATMLVA